MLLSAITDGVYKSNIYGEWHHIRPLCMYGSVELDNNYVQLRRVLHVKVHAALCYFFPSYYPLQNALNGTVNGGSHRTSKDVSAIALLKNEGKLAEIGLAQEKAAIHNGEFMKENNYAGKPPLLDLKIQQKRVWSCEAMTCTEKRRLLEQQGKPVPPDLQKQKQGKTCGGAADKYTRRVVSIINKKDSENRAEFLKENSQRKRFASGMRNIPTPKCAFTRNKCIVMMMF